MFTGQIGSDLGQACKDHRYVCINDSFKIWPDPPIQVIGFIDYNKKTGQVIKDNVLEKERKRDFEFSRNDRFRYRTRYFTDSGIIGSKEFVSINYQRFKDVFMSKRE